MADERGQDGGGTWFGWCAGDGGSHDLDKTLRRLDQNKAAALGPRECGDWPKPRSSELCFMIRVKKHFAREIESLPSRLVARLAHCQSLR